jgi:hypothetical protein
MFDRDQTARGSKVIFRRMTCDTDLLPRRRPDRQLPGLSPIGDRLAADRTLNRGDDLAKDTMYGGGAMGTFQPAEPPTFVEQPLAVRPGAAWTDREQRVEWCVTNLTPGEKAFLYRLLYNDGLRIDNCKDRERREKDSLK